MSLALSAEAVSAVIKERTGIDEDAFQDAWLRVIEGGISDEAAISAIAGECRRKNSSQAVGEMFRLKSLDAPLVHDDEGFALKDVIAAPEAVAETVPAKYLGKFSANQPRLDPETVSEIRRRYPGLPLGRAVRALVGLPPLEKRDAWQPWEDDVIRDRYPHGGSELVRLDVKRSRDAVIERARFLGVKRGEFCPSDEWMTPTALAKELDISPAWVSKLVTGGIIKPKLRLPGRRFGRIFFDRSSVPRIRGAIEAYQARCLFVRTHRPFKVARYWGKRHFVYRITDDGDVVLWCRKSAEIPNVHGVFKFVGGLPNCKTCLRALRFSCSMVDCHDA